MNGGSNDMWNSRAGQRFLRAIETSARAQERLACESEAQTELLDRQTEYLLDIRTMVDTDNNATQ